MRGYSLLFIILLIFPLVNAQYWFQSGARGGPSAQFNSGAQVTIQTVLNKSYFRGSEAYWVGENLQNGAFLQVGYVIQNQSGRYPSICQASGCSQYQYLAAGAAEWFYEYFPPGESSHFYGGIGPNASAGANGTYHTYGFYANKTTWYFQFDNKTVGSVNLQTNNSGYNDVVAFGELANTSNANTYLTPARFYNMSLYKFGSYILAPTGYSYIGYGVGSQTNIPNPYGVSEIGSRANAFIVGSGISQQRNNYPLWSSSYTLNIVSSYGNISSKVQYIPSKAIPISAPKYVYLSNNTRAAFQGWIGVGPGGYSGPQNESSVYMYSNITEFANWQIQYLVNVSSRYANASGSGWYPANSMARYSLNTNILYQNTLARSIFNGWNTNTNSTSATVFVVNPLNITAFWADQYFLNASSDYGKASGNGWYNSGSNATVVALSPFLNISRSQRLAFFSWNDGNSSISHTLQVNTPKIMHAIFRNQFLVNLVGYDEYNNQVPTQSFYLNNTAPTNKSIYLFANKSYLVTSAIFKGTNVTVNQQIATNYSRNISIFLPLYNVQVLVTDVFGRPVSVPVTLTLPNGTVRIVTVNQNGIYNATQLHDVPYGKALASAQYLGLQLSSAVQYGSQVKFTVVSVGDIIALVLVLIASIVMYHISSKYILGTSPVNKKADQ